MFKKILLSAAFSAAALGTIPAMAAAPALTPSEQATVKKLKDFGECLVPTTKALKEKIESGVNPIVAARSKATIEAAKALGMTQDQAEKLSRAMDEQAKAPESAILFSILASGEEDPRITCGKKLGIANNQGPTPEFLKELGELQKKYPDGPPAPPSPT